MVLVYIHGANATPASFNYIREQIGDGHMLSYDSRDGFKRNLEHFKDQLDGLEDITFIAHSLGGIYALHLANHIGDRVQRGITMSTPYGGHSMADYARFFMPFDTLLNDICPSSWPMRSLSEMALRWPWTNVITTRGNVPWVHGENDGVVTIDSQKHKPEMELIETELNHYEVVLSPITVGIIRARLDQSK